MNRLSFLMVLMISAAGLAQSKEAAPDPKALVGAGARTLERLKTTAVSYDAIINLRGGFQIDVAVISAPEGQR